MIRLIEQKLDSIHSICRRHQVRRLELFGSASDPSAFDPGRSDIDFIVSFAPGADLGPWMAEFFQLRDELQQSLQRPVELVMEKALRNSLFRSEAEKTRQVLYAAPDTEAA